MATKAEVEAKYAEEEARLKDRFARDLERIQSRKERELERTDDVEEEAQAAITTTSVGDASSQGGSANYAPHMGTFSRRKYTKPPKKHKKKEKKKAWNEQFVNEYFDD